MHMLKQTRTKHMDTWVEPETDGEGELVGG